MILSQVPLSERIFIDANIFLYSVFEHPAYGRSCREFLKHVENDEIKGFTSDLVLCSPESISHLPRFHFV